MFKDLGIFKMSHAMAVHAGQKQAVAAENVANSDTPGFKARDIAPFASTYVTSSQVSVSLEQKATRTGHLNGASGSVMPQISTDETATASPNGNTVSLEAEMLKSLSAKRQHDRALAIYKSAMTILRTSISSR